jgi:hypothetical protein
MGAPGLSQTRGRPLPAGLIPLVLGVTGHRRLRADDTARLEAAVRDLLTRLRRAAPSTPFLLITPLAEGADRLVARVALDLGAELVVPLPLARDEYARDFPGSLGEFDALLEDPRTVRRLVLPALPHVNGPLPPRTARELQYAATGVYVARHSQILIALWDGAGSTETGGTAQIVQYRRSGRIHCAESVAESLEGAPHPFALQATPLDPPDTGPVYQVVTPRADRPSPDNPFAGRWLQPEGSPGVTLDAAGLPASLADRLNRIEAFNADAIRVGQRDAGAVESTERRLYDGAGLPAPTNGLRRAFALADVLSTRYQRETYGALGLLYALVFVGVICFEIYAHLFPPADPRIVTFLAAYLAVIGIADLVYLHVRRRQSQNRFQDYRAVAEGLRVQFYWRLAGLADSAADYYLRKQRDELAWIRDALRAWGVRAGPVPQGDAHSLATRWIESQRDYFVRATKRDRGRLQRYRSVAAGIILASLGGAVPAVRESLKTVPAGEFNWLNVLQVPLLAVSLVLAWHLAFKGSQVVQGSRRRGPVGAVGELKAFGASLLLGAGFMWVMWSARSWAPRWFPLLPRDRHTWVVVALGLVTVAAAMVQSYTQKRAFGEHARQYSRMAEIFARAGERMAALLHDGKIERAGALAVELGKEALAEHGDWVILHRERPVELPKGKL